jgi:hypothetical protein
MPGSRSRPKRSPKSYWEKRLRSKEFERGLEILVAAELRLLSRQRIRDVIGAKQVREALRDWGPDLAERELIADLIVGAQRSVERDLRKRSESVLDVLGKDLAGQVDAILEADARVSPEAEEIVATLMRQEFMQRLFTDIIFTSIVSFYQRVSPLFGSITLRALEEQIKGFIRLFMPMIQERAIAFALDERNQRIASEFGRQVARQLLREPLRHYPAMISDEQSEQAEAFLRSALADDELDGRVREAVAAGWDGLYRRIRDRRVGDVLRLDEHAERLAPRVVAAILPVLRRPSVAAFVAAEARLATEKN